jgi:DNA-binding beta-propeller fold protein YncE
MRLLLRPRLGPLGLFLILASSNGLAQRVIDTVAVGPGPGPLAVNAATNKIYVTNSADYPVNTITVIDGSSDSTVSVNVGLTPYDVAVDSTRNRIYVVGMTSSGLGAVTLIDGATLSTTTMPAGRGAGHAEQQLPSSAVALNLSPTA